MKRFFGIVIAVVMALILMSVLLNSAHARPEYSVVSLLNPGFDSDLSGWIDEHGNYAWSGDHGHNSSGVAVYTSTEPAYMSQIDIPVDYAGIYTLSVWVQNDGDASYEFNVEMLSIEMGEYNYSSGSLCNGSHTDWYQCVISGYIPTGHVLIGIYMDAVTGSGQWMDDVLLVRDEQTTPSFYTCTLSYGHTFDFGLMLLGEDTYVGWNIGFNAPQHIDGLLYTLILESSAGYSDFELFLNGNNVINHTFNNSASTVVTQTACYTAGAPHGAAQQCAEWGTFDYVRGTSVIGELGGPGPVFMQFTGAGHLGYGPSASYVRATLRNMYVVYYGIPGPSCNTTPPVVPPTAMPTPTRTPGPTGTPPAPTPTLMPTVGVMAIKNPLKEIQDAVDAISSMDSNITRVITTTDIRTNPDVITVGGWSPFVFFRGMIILLEEFEWLTILAGWFAVAMLIIVAVTGLRLLISFWGIIERILQLLDLIPFT